MPDLWIKGENLFDHMRGVNIAGLVQAMSGRPNAKDNPKIQDVLAGMITFTSYFGLSVSRATVDGLVARAKAKQPISPQELTLLADVLRNELIGKSFMMIRAEKRKYWEGTQEEEYRDIFDQFPTCIEDYAEAFKCFSVGRNTATVFHLMRAMEAAVKEIGKHLGIANVEKAWGKILADIDVKIKAMPAGKNKKAWNEVRANLYHVKECWRNETMHPKQTYTEQEAKAIIEAVAVFMRKLASLTKKRAVKVSS